MSQVSRSHFTTLTHQEKQSKLWQLAQASGECYLWVKGQSKKIQVRVKDYRKDDDLLVFHSEDEVFQVGQELLGTFNLRSVSFFFKSKIKKNTEDNVEVVLEGDFFKSEKRQNFRLLTYPIYTIHAEIELPDSYEGGKVIDFKSRVSQTGLFKSFLKLVNENEDQDDLGKKFRVRVQDLSATGLSIHVSELEAEWFNTGDNLKPLSLIFSDEVIEVSKSSIVYIVDHIGSNNNNQKIYKVGIRFDPNNDMLDSVISKKINSLLREIDSNKEFEDFIK
jgi:hypothetical protein